MFKLYLSYLLISSSRNWIRKLVLLGKSPVCWRAKMKKQQCCSCTCDTSLLLTPSRHTASQSFCRGCGLVFLPFSCQFYLSVFLHSENTIALFFFQTPALGSSLTTVDSGLLSTLLPSQVSLSLFLSSPDGATVSGTGVILPYLSTGTPFLWGLYLFPSNSKLN